MWGARKSAKKREGMVKAEAEWSERNSGGVRGVYVYAILTLCLIAPITSVICRTHTVPHYTDSVLV